MPLKVKIFQTQYYRIINEILHDCKDIQFANTNDGIVYSGIDEDRKAFISLPDTKWDATYEALVSGGCTKAFKNGYGYFVMAPWWQ